MFIIMNHKYIKLSGFQKLEFLNENYCENVPGNKLYDCGS